MNQKQKALAEKAVKIRYNGLIRGIRDTASLAEREIEGAMQQLRTDKLPRIAAGINWGCGTRYNRDKGTHESVRTLNDGKPWPVEVEADANSAYKALQTAETLLEELHTAITAYNESIDERIKELDQQKKELARKRLGVAQDLSVQRDDSILSIAFKGEDAEMMELLQALPTAASITKSLEDAGLKLTYELTDATGIGERNPKSLTGSVTVQVVEE